MAALPVVGVYPAAAHASRLRLFGALEHAFAVRFEARATGAWHGLDGAIGFAANDPEVVAADPPCNVLLIESGVQVELAPPTAVQFHHTPPQDRRLRGQTLVEHTAGCAIPRLTPRPGDAIMATCSDGVLWLRRQGSHGTRSIVSTPPEELDITESLRDHLTAGRFLGLLPLIQFLREIQPGVSWQASPLRAAFIFDDPNLRAKSYGYLRYPGLAQHARRHGYHVALASIPLDYRFAHPAAIRLFHDHGDVLSLAIHGNNHEQLELLRADSAPAATALAAQALRRTAAFERRSGLAVARVMCPPHEVCSDAMRGSLFRLGFEAICTAHLLGPDSEHASVGRVLAEWTPAQMVAGGLPILARHSLARSLDDVVLRAYLDQPLLLFGHHQDAAGGLDRLAEAAARINSLGSVKWSSLTEICRTNYGVRRDGSNLRVQLHARTVVIAVPEGVENLVVELPAVASTGGPVEIECGAERVTASVSEKSTTYLSLRGPFGPRVTVRVRAGDPVEAEDVPRPAWRLWPILRRGLTESRDRIAPLRRRAASVAD